MDDTKGKVSKQPTISCGSEENLQLKPEPVHTDNSEETALHYAMRWKWNVVKRLIDSGAANVDATDRSGQTALLYAAKYRQWGIVKKLIDSGATNLDATDRDGQTALMYTAKNGHLEAVTNLIESRASMDATDMDGKTALLYAALNQKWDVIEKLIDSGATNLDATDRKGETALLFAAKNDHWDIVTKLMDAGATNLDATDTDGWTALIWSARYSHVEAMSKLIESGACVDAITSKEETALLIAAMNHYWDIVETLMDAGATNLDATDRNGHSALILAAKQGHVKIVCKLRDSGAKTDMSGWTDLMFAAVLGDVDTTENLISSGVDVNSTNKDGTTALMSAAERGNLEVVCILIDAKAETNMSNMDGESACSLAEKNEHTEVARKLKESEAEAAKCEDTANGKPSNQQAISLSDLEFGKILGQGGQAIVYLGRWTSENRKVAIKKITGGVNEREVEILGQLDHPNVIRLLGIVNEDHHYFIVTEYADGGSLYDQLYKNHIKPSPEQSLLWAKEIAQGMDYLHQKKILHRDLKSSNVLLTAAGTAKICDFGSAKKFDSTTVHTRTGTTRWMAPEGLNGGPVSLSYDAFSYAMVMYELFSHQLPFAEISSLLVPNKILEGDRPDIPNTCELYIDTLMRRCWDANPKSRPMFQEILSILENKTGIEVVVPPKDDDITAPDPKKRKLNVQFAEGRPTPRQLQVLRWGKEGERREIRVLRTVAPRWRDVGIALDLDYGDLDSIETSCLKDPTRCIEKIIKAWLEKGVRCTWEGLIEALEDAEFYNLATDLRNALSC